MGIGVRCAIWGHRCRCWRNLNKQLAQVVFSECDVWIDLLVVVVVVVVTVVPGGCRS
jgi:hypothetical protein